MVSGMGDNRFLESTRGQIVVLLRQSTSTVDELARELDLSDNAVRQHLATLVEDGVVEARGVRRVESVGKPATEYAVTVEAETSFSKAYAPFLSTLLSALGDRMTSADLRTLMREVGHRMATATPGSAVNVAGRTEIASKMLNALGGVTTVERGPKGKGFRIRGIGCPLAVAVGTREEVCVAVQTVLRDVIGVPVHEECDRSERPQCHFAISS